MTDLNEAIQVLKGRIEELEETLRDIKQECRNTVDGNWHERIESINYLCNAALIEEGGP